MKVRLHVPGQHQPSRGGELNQAIVNAVVRGHSSALGRGPTRAYAFFRDNLIVVVMFDALTTGERSLVRAGRSELVHELRRGYEHLISGGLVDSVEELTGCTVDAFMSDSHIAPDLGIEIFVLDRPVFAGDGRPLDDGRPPGDGGGDPAPPPVLR
jgi:uncharacterized protein YbcI